MEFTANMLLSTKSVNQSDLKVDKDKFVKEFCDSYKFDNYAIAAIEHFETPDSKKWFTGKHYWSDYYKEYRNTQRYTHRIGMIRNLIWRMVKTYNLDISDDPDAKKDLTNTVLFWHIFETAEESHLDWEKAWKEYKIKDLWQNKYNEDPDLKED